MTDDPLDAGRQRRGLRELGAAVFAAGGLAAAFAAASCCALPVVLGMIGLGSAWLGAIALSAGPYQSALLGGAVVCLAGSALLMWRRPAAACDAGTRCASSVADRVAKGGIVVTMLLVALAIVLG